MTETQHKKMDEMSETIEICHMTTRYNIWMMIFKLSELYAKCQYPTSPEAQEILNGIDQLTNVLLSLKQIEFARE